MKFKTVATTVLLIVSYSNSAGFDCKKASTPTGKTICQHKHLSLADDAMSTKYMVSVEILDNMEQEKLTRPIMAKLKSTQKDFIKQRELCGINQDNIYNLTIKRYSQFDNILGKKFDCFAPAAFQTSCANQTEYSIKKITESQMALTYQKLFNTLNPIEKQKLVLEQKKFYRDVDKMWEREQINENGMCAGNYQFSCYQKDCAMMKKRTQYLKNRLAKSR